MELNATIPALLSGHAASHGAEVILRKKDRGIWNAVTWSGLAGHARAIGQGLRAQGVGAGEAVAVLSETRPELVYADLAILGCGAVSVAIHPEAEADRVGAILRETGAVLAVVEGEEQLDKILGLRAACPALRRVVIVDMKGLRDFHDPACMSLEALITGGEGQSDWTAAMEAVTPDQPAIILVPDTGPGRMLTHAAILREVDETARLLGIRSGDERLVVLPMSDPAERITGLYVALKTNMISNYLENPETATENLREVKPTVLGANVEAWERLHARATALADAATGVQKALYRWAVTAGGKGGPMAALANFLVLPAIRGQLGFGRLRVAYVGDGALSPVIAQWASALGITVRPIDPFASGQPALALHSGGHTGQTDPGQTDPGPTHSGQTYSGRTHV